MQMAQHELREGVAPMLEPQDTREGTETVSAVVFAHLFPGNGDCRRGVGNLNQERSHHCFACKTPAHPWSDALDTERGSDSVRSTVCVVCGGVSGQKGRKVRDAAARPLTLGAHEVGAM